MKNQIELFTKIVVVGTHLTYPILEYKKLSINQKINAKADMTGFQSILLNPRNGFAWMRDVCYWQLSNKWFWHYRVNHYKSLETIMWRKSRIVNQGAIRPLFFKA